MTQKTKISMMKSAYSLNRKLTDNFLHGYNNFSLVFLNDNCIIQSGSEPVRMIRGDQRDDLSRGDQRDGLSNETAKPRPRVTVIMAR